MRFCIRFGAAAFALTGLVSCLDVSTEPQPQPPSILDGAVPFAPPPRYRMWWSMVEACSGRTADFNRITWLMLPGAQTLSNGAAGGYSMALGLIVLAEAPSLVPGVVRHEMLHALLGVGGHPRSAFLGSCNEIALCPAACTAEAGGRLGPSEVAPEVFPQDVETRFAVFPAAPRETLNEGAMAVIISVTNPHPYPLWVRLTPLAPGSTSYQQFGVMYDNGDPTQGGGPGLSSLVSRFGLAANETRRYVFEMTAQAGVLGVRAIFNTDTTARQVFNIAK